GAGPFTYTWDFGDGQTSADATPAHVFAGSGDLTVLLHVIDADRTVETATTSIHVEPAMQAYLPVDLPPVNAVGAIVPFTVNVAAGTTPYTFLWRFGDGTTSTEQSPQHAYAQAGSYVSTVLVKDAVGGFVQLMFAILVPLAPASSDSGPSPW